MSAATAAVKPERIEPRFVERVWGTRDLSPYFPPQARPVGEVWFDAPGLPLLVKFIYTAEQLSVQVHPGDEYARRHHKCDGKTEMWHILSAEPGARVGAGFRERTTREAIRSAALDGTIEGMLNWMAVKPGDTFHAEAGVVHAIGAGLTLCEIQQNSDVTYRLYDYGRGRELHLDQAVEVCTLEPYDARRELPVRCACFETEKLHWQASIDYDAAGLPQHLLIVLEGSGRIEREPFAHGEVWLVPAGARFHVEVLTPATLLRTFRPV